MTKSNHGGYRKGAGRPPAMGKSETFSTRVTPGLRDFLEAEAKRGGGSISNVAAHLIRIGARGLAESRRTDSMKALLFLTEKLGEQIGPWEKDPTLFAVFRASLIRLLDMFKPAGETDTPSLSETKRMPGTENWSVEQWAQFEMNLLIQVAFREIDSMLSDYSGLSPDDIIRRREAAGRYGFHEAGRALGLEKLRGLK